MQSRCGKNFSSEYDALVAMKPKWRGPGAREMSCVSRIWCDRSSAADGRLGAQSNSLPRHPPRRECSGAFLPPGPGVPPARAASPAGSSPNREPRSPSHGEPANWLPARATTASKMRLACSAVARERHHNPHEAGRASAGFRSDHFASRRPMSPPHHLSWRESRLPGLCSDRSFWRIAPVSRENTPRQPPTTGPTFHLGSHRQRNRFPMGSRFSPEPREVPHTEGVRYPLHCTRG